MTNIKLNKNQETSLNALMDTFIATLDEQETKELLNHQQNKSGTDENQVLLNEKINTLAKMKGTDVEDCNEKAIEFMLDAVPTVKHGQILLILSLLNNSAGSFLLTGHFKPFTSLSRQQRESVLLKWKDSSLLPIRQLYRVFSIMVLLNCYGHNDALRKSIGYPYTIGSHPSSSPPSSEPAYHMLTLEEAISLQDQKKHWDVIIIGTGAGGGVMGAQVASSGKSVLVIEKGTYYQNHEMGPDEISGFKKLYEANGLFISLDGNLAIAAGSTMGGGTTVNWSASLKPHDYVMDEWAKETNNQFDVEAFKNDLETVAKRMGVTTEGIEYNNPNKILKEGCHKLSYNVEDIPQNTGGVKHDCKLCFVGCKDGVKQGTANSWLRDAEKYGAQFMDQTTVTKVIIKNGQAKGVECIKGNKTLTFSSSIVVVSAGSLNSPNILKRSGLKNKNIGKHLRVHPATIVEGIYEKEQNMIDGPIMTVVSDVENDKNHYGSKIEIPSVHPALASILSPWRGALHHKTNMSKFNHIVPMVIIARDMDSKQTVDEVKGRIAVTSQLSKHDESSLIEATIRAFRILAATGAKELHHSQFSIDPFVFDNDVDPSDAVNDPKFNAWLESVRKNGYPDGLFTAHQMGTCRMGINSQSSVTRVTGETWEVDNLFVCDASLFMTASGVNPSMTIQALALGVSRNVINKLT
ncbi:unnamed protein product [Cunninghamella blakesleeana]